MSKDKKELKSDANYPTKFLTKNINSSLYREFYLLGSDFPKSRNIY
tara:strand:- start:940 stop:1077 length:138 start_codon:yes stop_codon:yes gene_type:complete